MHGIFSDDLRSMHDDNNNDDDDDNNDDDDDDDYNLIDVDKATSPPLLLPPILPYPQPTPNLRPLSLSPPPTRKACLSPPRSRPANTSVFISIRNAFSQL